MPRRGQPPLWEELSAWCPRFIGCALEKRAPRERSLMVLTSIPLIQGKGQGEKDWKSVLIKTEWVMSVKANNNNNNNKNGRDDWTANRSFLSIKLSASSRFEIVMSRAGSPQACSNRSTRNSPFLNSPNSSNLLKCFQSLSGIEVPYYFGIRDPYYFHAFLLGNIVQNYLIT